MTERGAGPLPVSEKRTRQRSNSLWRAPFLWYFSGTSISLLGSAMAPVALAFAVLGAANSGVDLGLVLAARSVPSIAFMLLGGAFGDRFKRSTILTVSNAGAGATQGAVAALLLTGNYNLGTIVALEAANGLLSAFTTPAMRGIVPQVVDARDRQRANALLGSWKNGTKIFGPAIAGVIVTTAGGGWAIAADAATYVIAAGCMNRLLLPEPVRRRATSLVADVRDGWGQFRQFTWIWSIVAAFSVTNCLYVGVWNVLGPFVAYRTIGAASWGVVLGARAAGVLVTSALMYRVVIRRLLAVGQLCIVLGAFPLLVLGLYPHTVALVAAAFAAGLGSGVFGPAWETSLQQHVPTEVLSRVSSYDNLGSYIAVPIGQLAAAPLAAVVGTALLVTGAGAVWLVVAALPLAVRSVRHLESVVRDGGATASAQNG